MSFSQNVRFSGQGPVAASDAHPPGRVVAESVRDFVGAKGWSTTALDIWRDSGWTLGCRRESSEVEVMVAQLEPSEWMLQIAPAVVPGFVGRLRGKKPSASRDDIFDLAQVVSELLGRDYLGQKWRWDGFPDDPASTPTPTRWQGAA